MAIENNNFAVIFPGQGSQSLGMLKDLNESFTEVATVFNIASSELGYDLWDLIQNGPLDKLNETKFTQPALLASSYAIWSIFKNNSKNIPMVLAGHSLGEYSALVASGCLDFKSAIKLVEARGEFMQSAVPVETGAMAAILGLDNDKISEVLKTLNTDSNNSIEIANLNAIGQTVVAGHKDIVVASIDKFKAAGAKIVTLLDVSVPSHCSLMQPAVEKLSSLLDDVKFNTPDIPVIHNYNLESYNQSDKIKFSLAQQLISPVRWVETIEKIHAMGINLIYEFGPGSVLSKLCKRINKNIICEPVNTVESLQKLV